MQRKVSSTVQMIHRQLTGPAIEVLNHVPLVVLILQQARVYRVLRTISLDLCNVNSRAAFNIWQHTSIKWLRQNSNTMHEDITIEHMTVEER